jgi:hypothetical protein
MFENSWTHIKDTIQSVIEDAEDRNELSYAEDLKISLIEIDKLISSKNLKKILKTINFIEYTAGGVCMLNLKMLKNQLIYSRDGESKKLGLSDSCYLLWEPVEVHNSVTVRTLIEIIATDPEFYAKCLMCPDLPDIISKYNSPDFKKEEIELSNLVFRWNGECWNYKKYGKEFGYTLDVYGLMKTILMKDILSHLFVLIKL